MTADHPALFISAPISALIEGIFRDDTTIAHIREMGDFGIGTFNDLDGEMVVLDGVVHQLRADGTAGVVGDDARTPFACVTRFFGDSAERISRPIAAEALEAELRALLPSPNLVYAMRIEGRFSSVRARSVPRQLNFRPLAEVAASQAVFTFTDVEGTAVGFWTPSFLGQVHVPGFHLHFLTRDRTAGGHVLAAATTDVEVRIQHARAVSLEMPMTLDFLTMEATREVAADLRKVER